MEWNRRRLLAGMAATGVASVAGLTALTSDAVAYTNATTVGTAPSVRVEWRETYNGDVLETGSETADGPVLHVDGAQPGDYGTLAFRVSPKSDQESARAVFALSLDANRENGLTEPERKAGDSAKSAELADAVQLTAWFDTGTFDVSQLGGCNANRDGGETVLVDGSLVDADAELADGVVLGGDCLSAGESACVGISWALPSETGNPAQSDSVETSLSFTVESCGGGA